MVKKLRLLVACFPALLSACVPIYQEPTAANVPKATIYFNDAPHLGIFRSGGIYTDATVCKNLHAIKRKEIFGDSVVSVPANQLLTINYVYSEYLGISGISYNYNACSYIVSFIPKKDKIYDINVTEGATINRKKTCEFAMDDITTVKRKLPVKYVIREQNTSSAAIADLPEQCTDTHDFLTKLK